MNLEFIPKPVVESDEIEILLNGSKIGWIKEFESSDRIKRFHAGIDVPILDSYPALIQGFGSTKEEAITEAIEDGAKYAEKLSIGIAVLAAEIGGFNE